MSTPQSYANHRRWNPLVHYVLSPLLTVNVAIAFALFGRAPSLTAAWAIVTAMGLLLLHLAARMQVLTVQDRLIVLEMQLRMASVLPRELAARARGLRRQQLVGLRFASDAELPGLVERCLAGELPTGDAVKRAVRDWQADTLRA